MSNYRVAVSGDFRREDGTPNIPDFDLSRLNEAPGVDVGFVGRGPELSADELAGYDALILLMPRFTRASVPADGRLSIIARGGVGYDTVDVEACTDAGIALVITPDAVRRPVAVSVVTLMLALTGRLFDMDRITRHGPWASRTDYMGYGLVGRTFAQIGIGNIGAEVLRMIKPFDMRAIAHDPFVTPAQAEAMGVQLVDMETAFREADVLSVSCPLNDQTRGLVNAERLALMKPTAFLINTARGPVVDQADLTTALKERRIAGAGLDVLETEPPDPDDPILKLDNVILSPHALCWTDQMFETMAGLDIDAVLAVMRGQVPRNVVNQAVIDSPRFKDKLRDYRERFSR